MDAAQRQSFDNALNLILGGAPKPMWIESTLKRMVRRIRSWREAEARAPKRSDLKAKLHEFRDAVEVLKEGLSDPEFNVFLGHDWLPANVLYMDLVRCFDELSDRANRAALRLAGKGGVALASPTERDEAVSAMELCAWTVMHAMAYSRELDAIGPDNVDAQSAANHLWKAAGGTPLGSRDGNRPPTGWRDYFLSVKKAEQAGDSRSDGFKALLTGFKNQVLVELEEIC